MKQLFHPDSPMMKTMIWLSDMLQIQILWILFTVLGLGVVGFFPSTLAMFTMMRDRIYKDEKLNYPKRFYEEFKANIIRANILGYSLLAISVLLVVYFRMTFNIDNHFSTLFVFLGYGLVILFGLLTLYIFPVYAHFDLGFLEIIRHSFVFMVSVPFMTIAMAALVVAFVMTFERLLILVPFVSIAILAYGITYFAQLAFKALTQATGA